LLSQEQINKLIASFDKERPPSIRKVRFPELKPPQAPGVIKTGITYLGDVQVTLTAVLGETTLRVKDILALEEGAVLALECSSGDPVQLWVNNRKFARGEMLVINDKFVVRLHSIDAPHKTGPGAGSS